MANIVYFVHRNARIAAVVGVVFVAVSAAGLIGWVTAPV